jgi:hypothetical protein
MFFLIIYSLKLVYFLEDDIDVQSEITVEGNSSVVWDLELNVMAVYLTSDGTPGVVQSQLILPLPLAVELAGLPKDLPLKLNLLAHQPNPLSALFPGNCFPLFNILSTIYS